MDEKAPQPEPLDSPAHAEFLKAVKDVATYAARDEMQRVLPEELLVQIASGAYGRPAPGSHVLAELRRPFAPAAVKWKIQTEWGSGAIVVAHIDARLVIERLNKVVGFGWTDTYTPLGNGFMWCTLTVNGVPHTDVGKGDDAKAAVSDALKRAGVKFGIGVSIYALAAVRMNVGAGPGKLRTERKKKKQRDGSYKEVNVCVLDALNLEKLADSYGKWLGGKGSQFGEPLEHGDVEGATGMEMDVEPDVPADDDGPDVMQAEGEQADAARERARNAFDVLRERGEMLPGIFNRGLTAAGGSIEELEAFAGELEAQVAKEPEA
jgi:hypothetical protein